MKRTPWFSWPDMPTRVGWYEYRGPCLDDCRLWWNGRAFEYNPPFSGIDLFILAPDSADEWRGLTAPAKEQR